MAKIYLTTEFADLVRHSLGIMIDLRDAMRETVGLAVLLEHEACGQVIAQVRGVSDISFNLKLNHHFPLHSTAPGKAICAALSPSQRSTIMSRMLLARQTSYSITQQDVFERELLDIARRGYSTDREEQVNGCHCVGVPIQAACLARPAAIWVTGLSTALPEAKFPSIGATLKKYARLIEERLTDPSQKESPAYIDGIIEQARTVLDERVTVPVDMELLARDLHVGYSWFRRMFKQRTGQSPGRYHLGRRMDEAKRLLRETDMTVRQVAELMGYESQSYFSGIFKKWTGSSPNHFRSSLGATRSVDSP